MKFTLTLYICSLINQTCYIPTQFPIEQASFYDCIKNGIGLSYENLFSQSNFTRQQIEDNQLYATYTCLAIENKVKKPEI